MIAELTVDLSGCTIQWIDLDSLKKGLHPRQISSFSFGIFCHENEFPANDNAGSHWEVAFFLQSAKHSRISFHQEAAVVGIEEVHFYNSS